MNKWVGVLASYILVAILTMSAIVAIIGIIGLLWFVVCSILMFVFDWYVPVAIFGIIVLCAAMCKAD